MESFALALETHISNRQTLIHLQILQVQLFKCVASSVREFMGYREIRKQENYDRDPGTDLQKDWDRTSAFFNPMRLKLCSQIKTAQLITRMWHTNSIITTSELSSSSFLWYANQHQIWGYLFQITTTCQLCLDKTQKGSTFSDHYSLNQRNLYNAQIKDHPFPSCGTISLLKCVTWIIVQE